MNNDTISDYHFEYKLEHPNYKSSASENMYKNYSQGHYIHLVQSERNRSTSKSNEKSTYVKNESAINKICECIIC